MYSEAIRQMMEFILHLNNSMVYTKGVGRIEFVSMNHKYVWDGYELSICSGKKIIKMIYFGLKNDNERNFISILTKRLNITSNHHNSYTHLCTDMTIPTIEMMVDEGTYHQHMVFADLPDYDEVRGIYDVVYELVENNISYFGSYRIPLLDMKHVARQLELKYPETKGCWGKYINE